MNRNMMERFSEACGAAGPLLVDVHDDGAIHRARRIFHQPYLICGRHPDADLELREERVSRRHCYVQTVGGRIFAIDLGTRAGIRVDGAACRTGWLDGSREMRLGPVRLTMQGGDRRDLAPDLDLASPLSGRYASEHPMPDVTLEIGEGGTRFQSWPMSRVLVLVGRSSGCKLRLLSPLVTDFHCALLRTESGVWLIDLLSQGGVYVDGRAIRVACLAEGAEIGVGPFVMRLRYGKRGKGAPGVEMCAPGHHQRTEPETSAVAVERTCVEAEPTSDRCGGSASFHPSEAPGGAMDDQLRQIMMMVWSLAAMQRDHEDVLREGTRELRGLAEELRTLRSELSSQHLGIEDIRPELGSGVAEVGGSGGGDFDWQKELQSILQSPAAEAAPSRDRWKGLTPAYDEEGLAGSQPRVAMVRPSPRDPRLVHAIATEFLSAYKLEGQSLRMKLMRALLGPHDATDMIHPSR